MLNKEFKLHSSFTHCKHLNNSDFSIVIDTSIINTLKMGTYFNCTFEHSMLINVHHMSVADPGFPRGGDTSTLGRSAIILFWPLFLENCMKNEENRTIGGVSLAHPPPPGFATVYARFPRRFSRDTNVADISEVH